jgi:hypothetical protein
MPSVNPIVPRDPRQLSAIAGVALFFLYAVGLGLLALSTTDEGRIGALVIGGILLALAITPSE